MKLKPCPFCGGEARIKDSMRTDGNIIYKTKYVQCVGCGAKTQEKVSCGYYSLHFTDEEAIELWNRREPMNKVVGTLGNTSERVTREVVELYRSGKVFSEHGVEYLVKKVFSEAIKLIENGGVE